jgi:hypothetical protein
VNEIEQLSYCIKSKNSENITISHSTFDGQQKSLSYGIRMEETSAAISDIEMKNFSYGGFRWINSSISLKNSTIKDMRMFKGALYVENSSVTAETVTVQKISANEIGTSSGWGIVVTGDKSSFELTGDSFITECSDSGVVTASGASLLVESSTISSNGNAGIWMQDAGNLATIKDSLIIDNALGGIYGIDISDLSVENSTISNTSSHEFHNQMVGDGIIVYSAALAKKESAIRLNNVTLDNNFRAGAIFDGVELPDTPMHALSFEKVYVKDVYGDENGIYGIVIQNGLEPEGLRTNILENKYTEKDLNAPLLSVNTEKIELGK